MQIKLSNVYLSILDKVRLGLGLSKICIQICIRFVDFRIHMYSNYVKNMELQPPILDIPTSKLSTNSVYFTNISLTL